MVTSVSTGFADLDHVIGGLRPGDNVVWKVDTIDYYTPFVDALHQYVAARGQELIYFRFARHEPVLDVGSGVLVHEVDPEPGFETFITDIHRRIKEHGEGGYYVFDSLSDLSSTCYSDRMIGNFFRLTCPYLRTLRTIAYFAMYRYYHSYHAAQPISQTTQILIDVFRHEGAYYVQPSKVEGRHTPNMFTLHRVDGESLVPVKASAHISSVIASSPWSGLASASYRMIGVWDKTFMRAEATLEAVAEGIKPPSAETDMLREVLRLIISSDERMLELAERYFSLPDVIHIWKRMIGTGMIGGKSVGMLMARAILKESDPKWDRLLEQHDSFFIGSDVFYTVLVANDCWWERQRQKDPRYFLDGTDEVRARIMTGSFPDYIVSRFLDMLDYFGQAPIIVRSSSLLEDNFGNAFSGKYESVFCANQGTREERLAEFMDAVRTIYASTIADDALRYRKMRGVLDRDEQMALLVQRVSGMPYGRYFFPQLAGVAYSFNPYAWNKEIDPAAGMLRLVFGLGTRAVDRSDDDYTRVVALNAPKLQPHASFDDRRRHSQRQVDALDMEENRFVRVHFLDVVKRATGLDVDRFATKDLAAARAARERRLDERDAYVLTLDQVLEDTSFVSDMRQLLRTVRDAYGTNVDIEFAANLDPVWGYSINVLQCRPLQIKSAGEPVRPLPAVSPENVIMRSTGGVIGHSRSIDIDRIIFVEPAAYAGLAEPRRYALARLIGRLTRGGRPADSDTPTDDAEPAIMIVGPGRWGTSTPSLGIPVTFSEINAVSVLCEIDTLHEGLVPDLSLGTHFFNDMVEMNMLYVAHFAGSAKNSLDRAYLTGDPHGLLRLASDAEEWSEVVFVREPAAGVAGAKPRALRLHANAVNQTCVLYTTP